MAHQGEAVVAAEESAEGAAAESGPPAGLHRTCIPGASLERKKNTTTSVYFRLLPFVGLRKGILGHRLTLLRHGIVVHGWLRRITTATVLLLSSVHLGVRSHRIALLRVSVSHWRHPGCCHAAKASAHAVPHSTAATGWVATTRAVVGCPVDTNGASVKSINKQLQY